jgi:hypothetical protein
MALLLKPMLDNLLSSSYGLKFKHKTTLMGFSNSYVYEGINVQARDKVSLAPFGDGP